MKKLLFFFVSILFIFQANLAYASRPLHLDSPGIILVEQTTGQVLCAVNEHERMYPASMSKMLTALVVIDHLDLDAIVTVGPEIRNMPAGYQIGLHVEGEQITVRVLLKALIIRSSNEAGRILAINTIREVENRRNIFYDENTKRSFSVLLNQKSRSIGAYNSNFNNPYGLHSEFHFTTPYDMALITRAFMENEILAEMARMSYFEGNGLENFPNPEGLGRNYSFLNTNQMLPGKLFGHPYIIGARTGFTTPAGHCFAAAAYNDGLQLVSVVMGGETPEQWQDTRRLIDFGFSNYRFREITQADILVETAIIENPRLGDINTLEIFSSESYTMLISHDDFRSLRSTLTFDPLKLVEDNNPENQGLITLLAPIEEGSAVGFISYFVGENLVFQADILAGRDVLERTFDSDMDYYLALFLANVFTVRALPYWFGLAGVIIGIFGLVAYIKSVKRINNRDRYRQKPRRRSRYDRD